MILVGFLSILIHPTTASSAETVFELEERWDISKSSYHVDWHPSSQELAFATEGDEIHLRERSDGSLISRIKVRNDPQLNIGPNYVSYSPNGTWIAVWGYSLHGGNLPDLRTVKVYDRGNLSLVFNMEFEFNAPTFDWSPDGLRFAVGTVWDSYAGSSPSNWTYIVSSISLEILEKFESPASMRDLEWSPDGSELLVLSYAGLQKWNESGIMFLPHSFPKDIRFCCLHWASFANIGIFSEGSSLIALDLEEMSLTNFLEVGNSIENFALSPDETVLALDTSQGHLEFYQIDILEEIYELSTEVTSFEIAWSPDGLSLAIAGIGHTKMWSYSSDSNSFPFLILVGVALLAVAAIYGLCAKMRGFRKDRDLRRKEK